VRIGLVIKSLDPRRGGAEAWTYQHAKNLLERGHEVHVVARDIPAETAKLPIVIHRLQRIRTPMGLAKAAEAKLRSLNLDLIHDMGLGWYSDIFQPHSGCWTAITRQKLRIVPPWLRPIKRRVDPWLPRYRQLNMLAGRQAAAENNILLALSQKVADEFQQFYRMPQSRIRVVYNGVDAQRFSPQWRAEFRQSVRQRLGIKEDTVLALVVAHNFRLKGVPTLLQALEILAPKHLPIHAVVVGGKRIYSWQIKAKMRRLPVTFLGPQPDTVPYYAAADMLVHPSFYDSCSLVLLEAAASGLPLLVSRESGASELISDGVEGLLLDDSADAERLAAQLESMLDASKRERMGAAARQLAVKHPLERNCDEILAIYRQAAKSRHGWFIKDMVRPSKPVQSRSINPTHDVPVQVSHSRITVQSRAPYPNRITDAITNEAEIADEKEPLKNI
jgi:UDP-glucose:(heptosyl)LPS alpha-1,3-glucosyltransferase